MLKRKTKIQKRLAKLVLTALLCTGGMQGLYSPSSVEASEVTVTGCTGITFTPAGSMKSDSGDYAFIPADTNTTVLNLNGDWSCAYSIYGHSENSSSDVSGYTVNLNGPELYYSNGDILLYGAKVRGGGNATDNHVKVSAGTVIGIVAGGLSSDGNAIGNSVEIEGGTFGGGYYAIAVTGGISAADASGNANNNTVIIKGGNIGKNVVGGCFDNYFASGNANENTVTISGGTVTGDVNGGQTNKGNANGNTVTITGGTVGTESGWVGIRGGSSSSGTANNNTVTISGGTINNDIWGGMGATADGNTVTISGENTVFLSTKGIHGAAAMTGDATNNTVNILTPVSVAYLYGGLNEAGGTTKSTGNTLNIAAKNVVAKDLNAFQNMNFFLPSDIANGNTMLTVNGSQKTDVKGVTFGVAALSGVKLEKGNTVNLLVNANGLTTDDTLKTTDSASLGSAAFLAPNSLATDTKYELSISKKDANTIIATVDNVTNTDPTPDPEPTPSPDPTPTPDPDPKPTPTPDYSNNERLKSLVETRAGVVTMINAGADMLAGQGMSNAAEAAADTRAGGGFEAFGAVSGGKLRAESGSHVDTKGIGLNLGFARELSNKQGKLLFGPVIEYGHGSYDSYQDNGIKADGKTSYWGLGLIAKQTNHSGFYYEGSLRVGKTKSDYSSDLSPVNHANYDSKATYWAAHLGIGKMMDVGKDNTLDVYGKYFYSHTGSDNVTVHATSGDEEINFDAVNSHRLRIGTRLTHALNEKNKIYGGLAWQYEFKGDARATYNGGSTPSPSVKGSSGMIELGWQVKPGKSPMTIDLGVTGWVGKQRGITANLQANWTF